MLWMVSCGSSGCGCGRLSAMGLVKLVDRIHDVKQIYSVLAPHDCNSVGGIKERYGGIVCVVFETDVVFRVVSRPDIAKSRDLYLLWTGVRIPVPILCVAIRHPRAICLWPRAICCTRNRCGNSSCQEVKRKWSHHHHRKRRVQEVFGYW